MWGWAVVALHARSGSLACFWVGPLPGSNSRRAVGDQTFIPNSLMCKKQTSVSHSSSEAELTSSDAGVIMHDLRAVQLWDCVLSAFILTCQILILWLIMFLPTFLDHFVLRSGTFLKTTEAVIRMIASGRSPSLRHVARAHRANLDWLFERSNLDSATPAHYVRTNEHLADILTKGSHLRNGSR